MTKYLYIMVRKDLTPQQIVVQSCHAVWDLGNWYSTNNIDRTVIILLSAEDESYLKQEKDRVDKRTFPVKAFYERDLDGQMTAWACVVDEENRKYFRQYKTMKELM